MITNIDSTYLPLYRHILKGPTSVLSVSQTVFFPAKEEMTKFINHIKKLCEMRPVIVHISAIIRAEKSRLHIILTRPYETREAPVFKIFLNNVYGEMLRHLNEPTTTTDCPTASAEMMSCARACMASIFIFSRNFITSIAGWCVTMVRTHA